MNQIVKTIRDTRSQEIRKLTSEMINNKVRYLSYISSLVAKKSVHSMFKRACILWGASMWRIVVILFTAHSLMFASQKHCSIHALLVNDHSSTYLKQYSESDTMRMQNFLCKMATTLNITCHVRIIDKSQATPHTCKQWIHSIPNIAQKIIFLYYSGKGAKGTSRTWPCFSCDKKRTVLISTNTITKWMRKKRPQLTISLFDCYSELGVMKCLIPNSYDYSKVAFKNGPLLTSLFLNTKGIIIGASASKGKRAGALLSRKEGGGNFTTELLSIMKNNHASKIVSWNDVASLMKEHSHGNHPTPIFYTVSTKLHKGL